MSDIWRCIFIVHVADLDAGAGGDALAARAVDHVGIAALVLGHGGDDRLLTREDPVVQARGISWLFTLLTPGSIDSTTLHAAELLHLLQLLREDRSCRTTPSSSSRRATRTVPCRTSPPPSRPARRRRPCRGCGIRSGWKASRRTRFFTDAEVIGAPVTARIERRTTARIAVCARENDAAERDALVKRLRDVHCVLAGPADPRPAASRAGSPAP